MSATNTYDVIVVGGGIAGLSAANRAAELGLRVALIERGVGEQYLCNSRMAGGVLHVAFHSIKDRPERLVEAIQAATRGQADPALTQALAQTSERAGYWLRNEGAKIVSMSLVIDWQRWVLAPPRRIRPGADWEGRGPDYTLRTLAHNLLRRGGHILRGAAATTLLERNGACAGVEIRVGGAAQYMYSRAVILADGGFQGNLELLRQHICAAPEKLMQRGASTGLGDGLRMARDFGAQLSDLEHFYGHVLSRDAFHNPKTWPYPQLDELGVAGLVVGPDARRFADEGLGGVSLANAIAQLPDPLSAWAIFDSAIWETAGRSARIPANPHLENAGGTILKSESLQDLATQAGLPAPALQATVAAYRQAIIDNAPHQLTPPRTASARRPWPIDCPPYYATPICAGITYTMGGILIDEHSRVRSPNGAPIAGLYAAGATTAGLEGRASPTYVGGLMKGLVFGLRAAEHVALTFIHQPQTLTLNG